MPHSEQHTKTKQVQQQLKAAYTSLTSKKKGRILLQALLILFAGLTTLVIAEHVLYLSIPTKSLLLFLLVSASGYAYWMGHRTKEIETYEAFYRQFSRKSNLPELKDTLDLEQSGQGNQALIDAAILQNLSKIEPARLQLVLKEYIKQAESATAHKKLVSFSMAIILVFSITSLNFEAATHRTFAFWKAYTKPNPYSYRIEPKNVTIEQGSSFQAKIIFQGEKIAKDVQLKVKTTVEKNYRTRAMEGSDNTFTSIPQDLNNALQYYVEMDGYKSEVYHANVQLRPRFNKLQATIFPPSYTRLDSNTVAYPMSQIRAYEGSHIKLSGTINKSISSLQLFAHQEPQDITVNDDSTFHYKIPVKKADTLRFYIEDENGLTNKNPFQIIIAPQADEYPLVELVEPSEFIKEVNPKEINLLFRATDDFGLTSAVLNFELKQAYVEKPLAGKKKLKAPEVGKLQPFQWDLKEFELKPQDELSFWITVKDNDGYNGYKSSQSQVIKLEVPSLVYYFEDIDEKENDVSSNLEDISEAFKQTQDQYEQFKEKMKDNPEKTGYEEKRALEQAQKQQEEVQKKINELNEKFEELKKDLSKDDVLSEETQKAYDELQKLMKEIDDPAFKEAMEKMQEQMGKMNPEQMRKAMEQIEFNEELYKERLQRTIDLFKQLKLNSDLDKLAKSFEDMARKEKEQKADGEKESEKNQQQLEKAIEENQKLKEQLESLTENASKKNEKEIQKYQEQSKQELDELSKDMKQELESGEENSDTEGQEKSQRQQKYEQLAEKTQALMQQMQQKQKNINVAGLQYVLYSLLDLSLEQEDLTTLVASTENRSQAYINYARNQRNVEDIFGSISDSLFQLSSEIPQFSNQINKKKVEVANRLESSLKQMSERNQNQSSVASRQALGGINDIAFMVANLLEQLQNSQGDGPGGGGMSMQQMMKQLQEMGQQQQQLNQMMQDMINDIQGDRLSQDQMERMSQMAKQQNKIRKQLQQIQQQGEMGGDKVGSELQRMIEDMEDTINDLRGGSTDRVMIKRQQNILSRMLEAEQALQERDEEDKREATTAEEYRQNRPPELTIEELEKQIRSRLNDPNFTKYSPDYQRLIENYFELLKQLQEREEADPSKNS